MSPFNMKLLILSALVGIATADIGIGYDYKPPQSSYGFASQGNSAALNNVAGSGYQYNSFANYQGSSYDQQSLGYQNAYQTGSSFNAASAGYQPIGSPLIINSGSSVVQPSNQYSGATGGYQSFNHYQTSSGQQTSAVEKYKNYYNQVQQQPPQIFKHYYVHAAPEEPEVERPRKPIVLPPPQKHYQIIFIKSPSQTVYTPQYIPVPQQDELKTVVYVLAKNPEEPEDIPIPKVEPKPPTKPEVYFVKYNKKEDFQPVIDNIINKGDSSFTGISQTSSGVSSSVGSGQYTGSASTGSSTGSTGSGHYTGSTSTGQYTGSTSTGQFGGSNSGQYGSATTGQYTGTTTGQIGSTGQYYPNVLTSNQYSTGGNNHYSHDSSSGYDGTLASIPAINSGNTANSGTAGNGYTSLTAASSSTNSNYDTNAGAISTVQGVPHETYGPPTFRTVRKIEEEKI